MMRVKGQEDSHRHCILNGLQLHMSVGDPREEDVVVIQMGNDHGMFECFSCQASL